ncbi:MAG TPA: amidohydrolase family protein [Acidimicrobiales bacterium]|jgi:predicted TIM-barrel fold metal-dependent hydrolase|nr:amidohydrolase family protein [Acidimicrobiales bacterium]
MEAARDLPLIISVDDHVVEPPHMFEGRLPKRLQERAPRVERGLLGAGLTPQTSKQLVLRDDGDPGDYWVYEGKSMPLFRHSAASGLDRNDIDRGPVTFEAMRPGCYDPAARLLDMDLNHVEASLCFPTMPRFCGQTFYEADDKELGLACVRAFNDWMVDEWCGASGGRLIPLCLIPLWDPDMAAAEVRRNAARGVHAVAFSEIPPFLGLPSVHDASRHWDPFLAACAETDTTVCMHIGSATKLFTTSDDAPSAVAFTLTFNNAMASLADFLFSGTLARFPQLKLAYSEAQIGWLPYVLERADDVWGRYGKAGGITAVLDQPPSEYFRRQVYGCFFKDQHGLDSLDRIGADNITFETDYPHGDSTWPDTKAVAEEMFASLDDETVYKIVRGNAIRMLSLDFDRERV